MAAHSHAHSHREILFVLSGDGYHGVEERVYQARAGTVFFFGPLVRHDQGYAPGEAGGDHLWVTVLHDACVARLLRVRPGRARFSQVWSLALSPDELGLSAPSAMFPPEDGEPLPPALARMRCFAGAVQIAACLAAKGFGAPAARPDLREEIVDALMRHIRDRSGSGCRLDHLARIAGYSKFHFLRVFRERAGMGLRAFIDLCRADRCRAMLAAGARHKAVSAALGFAHPSAFTRWRKRQGIP